MSVTAGDTAVVLSTGTRVLESTKTVNYQYVYNGGSLSQMVVTTTIDNGTPTVYTFNFQYDAGGTPMSMVVNGSEKLYYVTNLQGDVVALLNEDGDEVATYSYSAYGEMDSEYVLYSAETVMASIYGAHLYRSYVHDIETGWYYLQSRYYDPEVGRFINADAFASTGQGLLGNNMFAYCLNNPIVLTDPSGTVATAIFEICYGYTDHYEAYCVGSAVSCVITDDTIYLDAYMTFIVPGDKNPIISGAEDYWSGSYNVDGNIYNVVLNIHEGFSAGFNTIFVIGFYHDSVRSQSFTTVNGKLREGRGAYIELVFRDGENLPWVLAHELGHCFGVDDYYDSPTIPKELYNPRFNSIFAYYGANVSAFDIKKVVTAFRENCVQVWTGIGGG